jgi:hypothetical protein
MSERLPYAEEEEHPGQFELWAANVRRSLKGREGQKALRRLETALLELPVKELSTTFTIVDGEACALSQLAIQEGKTTDDLRWLDEDISEAYLEISKILGIPKLVAWAIIEVNDEKWWYSEPPYIQGRRLMTKADRYERMLSWTREMQGVAQ